MLKTKVLAAALALLLLAGCAPKAAQETDQILSNLPTAEETRIRTTAVVKGDFTYTASAQGQPFCPHVSYVKIDYEGAILKEKILVSVGDSVTKGQALATFYFEEKQSDYDELVLKYNQARNTYSTKLSEYQSAIAQLQDSVSLSTGYDKDIASLKLESKQLEMQQYIREQEATIETAKEAADELGFRLNNTVTLTAPGDGIVYSIAELDVGASPKEGNTIVTVYQTDYVLFEADSGLINEFYYNMEVTVNHQPSKFNAKGRVIGSPYGMVETTADAVLDDTKIYILVEDAEQMANLYSYVASNPTSFPSLHVGIQGVVFTLQNTLYLELDAVNTAKNGESYVYTVQDDGSTLKTYIVCGPANNDCVSIMSGLSEGQLVVMN